MPNIQTDIFLTDKLTMLLREYTQRGSAAHAAEEAIIKIEKKILINEKNL